MWGRRALGSCAVSGASAFMILLHLVAVVSGKQCVSYTPKTCLFAPEIQLKGSTCHPRACEFSPEEDFKCGFPETGEFSYEFPDAKGNCPDSFMSTHREPPSPCGTRCCRADHQGDFYPEHEIPGNGGLRYSFQPIDNKCRYDQMTRGQILKYFNTIGAPLVVVGDSMMRQFFLRLVMMLRGQSRLLDYHAHAHAQYAVCREADIFRLSTSSSNLSTLVPNNEHLKNKIPSFFQMRLGPGRVAGYDSLAACSRAPAQFHYLHSPRWKNQVSMVSYYFQYLPPGIKPIIMLSVGYWEGAEEVPQDYIDLLASFRDRARKIIIISVPKVRVPDLPRAENYVKRNAFMKSWVETQGEPYAFLDFDGISGSRHVPPGGSMNNWHYMCSISWRTSCSDCNLFRVDHADGMDEHGNALPQITQGSVERIHATEDGLCADEMNRNMWQVVFNMLLKPAKSM